MAEQASCSIADIISKKRDGKELSTVEIQSWINGLLDNSISQAQLGAWLMAVFLNGLNERETVDLTRIMTDSGETLQWPEQWSGILVDKHSTGGVGDKVSLVLAPALAAHGRKVPMISGRGLGITGGTLDKLESIPGFNVTLSSDKIREGLDKVGCVIAGQTGQIAPADKIMYACRDITCTVGSLSLVTSSILSKKAAENIKALVLDVKYGKGCYQETMEKAEKMAYSLVKVANAMGIKTTAVISQMDDPLGKLIGNSLEVAEAIECLKGKGPQDLEELVVKQGGLLLAQSGMGSPQQGEQMILESLHNGKAMKKFQEMIEFQGAFDANELCNGNDMWSILPRSHHSTPLKAHKSGIISHIDALILGKVCVDLGAGRSGKSSEIDLSVGIELLKTVNDEVRENEEWIRVFHKDSLLGDSLKAALESALHIDENAQKSGFVSKIVKIVE